MANGEIKRAGRAGVVVEFRHKDTEELLFEAPMQTPPEVDSLLTFALDDDDPVTYKVEEIRRVFRNKTITVHDEHGNPIRTVVPEFCRHEPIAYLSVVP